MTITRPGKASVVMQLLLYNKHNSAPNVKTKFLLL